MKRIGSIVAFIAPTLAGAQPVMNSEPTMNMPNYSTWQASVESYAFPPTETPTMRRQKLTRALALRSEAAQLLETDGGTFTPRHEAYIRRKARDILYGH